MISKTFRIFGKKITINGYDCNEFFILLNELSLYPVEDQEDYDVVVNYVKEIPVDHIKCINPSSHIVTNKGFICDYGCARIYFKHKKNNIHTIYFSLRKERSNFVESVKRFINIQYATNKEAIGQIFHELVLVPLAILDNELAIIHASAIRINNKTVLFSGTGGVGKTSMELELCYKKGAEFIADDIAVVDVNGNIYANLAYPKIYGYNLQEDSEVKEKIFSDTSFINKLSWKFRSYIKGVESVRRRVSPKDFYQNYTQEKQRADLFLFIRRGCDVENIEIVEIDETKASLLNRNVIIAEYFDFYNHLLWNEISEEENPLFFDTIKSIERVSFNFFEKINCYYINIPISITHSQYKEQMVSILENFHVSGT